MKIKSVFLIALLGFALFSFQVKDTKALFTDQATATGSLATGVWVLPEVTLTSPNGGETLYQGETYNVSWSAAGFDPGAIFTVDLYYSLDGGITYPNVIALDETNDGSLSWTVPNVFSSSIKVKVVATDNYNLSQEDISDVNFTIKSGVVLNEFLPNPAGNDDAVKPGGEWVELYNNSSVPVNVNGWVLYDSFDTHDLIVTTSNSDNNGNISDEGETIVPAHGFLLVYRNGDGNFTLNNTGGDSVRLYNGLLASSTLIDNYTYTFSPVPDNKSFARIPDGVGDWVDPDPTPGQPNQLTFNYLLNLQTTLESSPSANLVNSAIGGSLLQQADGRSSDEKSLPILTNEASSSANNLPGNTFENASASVSAAIAAPVPAPEAAVPAPSLVPTSSLTETSLSTETFVSSATLVSSESPSPAASLAPSPQSSEIPDPTPEPTQDPEPILPSALLEADPVPPSASGP